MEVRWSHKAKEDYWVNIDYLINEWTLTDAGNFIEKADAVNKLQSMHK